MKQDYWTRWMKKASQRIRTAEAEQVLKADNKRRRKR